MEFPKQLSDKLDGRIQTQSLRSLGKKSSLLDFSSNDYLGFAASKKLYRSTLELLEKRGIHANGATGSRLLSGNHELYQEAEAQVADFHDAPAALIYNSGYDANVGFFSSVPQKGDFIIYDELCHASIRDGIRLSFATAYKFRHNDIEQLGEILSRCRQQSQKASIYIATESVFSMDGDSPDPAELISIAEQYNALPVFDEAHGTGVFGSKGEGLLCEQGLQHRCFARIVTFGKAVGCHGAAILGPDRLKDYLINFSRSFIYSTGLSPHAVAAVICAYTNLSDFSDAPDALRRNIVLFNRQKNLLGLKPLFVRSKSAIQSAIIPGNKEVKQVAAGLRSAGFDVKPILSPTVPEGQERLRICLHNYNTEADINRLLKVLLQLINNYGK